MSWSRRRAGRAVRVERGATAVEYALVIGVVSLLVIAGLVGLGAAFAGYADDLVAHVNDLLGA